MDELFGLVVVLKHNQSEATCPLDGNCTCNGYEDCDQCNPDDD